MDAKVNEVEINGVAYVKKGEAPKGNRHIVVLDRGWIFVGQVQPLNEGGMSIIRDCYNVRNWKTHGFGGLTLNPVLADVTLDKCADIYFRAGSEIFMVAVPDDWHV